MSQEKAKPEGELSAVEEGKITGLKLVTLAPATSKTTPAPSSGGQLPSVPPPSALPARDPYVGCTIDNRYKVESILGEGGMGVVYQCRHKIIGKKVAMKILRADLARDPEVTERFLIEAQAASSIGDEHIIDISDFGQLPDGSAYFVMEFLEGRPLSSLLQGGAAVHPDRILELALQLTSGLAAAHRANIVHRDLKPDNIFLVQKAGKDNFVKILDFGIAKVTSGATSKLTQAGSVFGTPHYMSPEQAAGAAVDLRGDVYSFGIILYELACGKVPFDADNFMSILTQHMYKAPSSVREMSAAGAAISPGLEAVILKCISKQPELRYQSMEDLAQDLRRLQSGEVPGAVAEMMERDGSFSVPTGFFEPPPLVSEAAPSEVIPMRTSRSRWPIVAAVSGVAALALGVALLLSPGPAPQAAVPDAAVEAAPPVAQPTAVAPAPAPVAPAPTADPVAAGVEVVIGVSPIGAHAFLGDKDLGSSPVIVNVPKGKSIELTLEHPGFKSKTLELDGTETKLSIKLDPLAKPKATAQPVVVAQPATPRPEPAQPPPKAKPPKKPPAQIGGGEIVNPWAN